MRVVCHEMGKLWLLTNHLKYDRLWQLLADEVGEDFMANGRWAIRLTGFIMITFVPLIFLGSVIAQDKEDTALFYQGQSLMEKKQPQGAAAKFDELLRKYPNSNIRDLAAYWLGRAYLDLGRISDAEVVSQQLQR